MLSKTASGTTPAPRNASTIQSARKLESMDAEEKCCSTSIRSTTSTLDLARTRSPDRNLLAYSLDLTGRELYTMRFIDLRTGEHLDDVIEGITRNVAWANDNTTCSTPGKTKPSAYQIADCVLGQSGDHGSRSASCKDMTSLRFERRDPFMNTHNASSSRVSSRAEASPSCRVGHTLVHLGCLRITGDDRNGGRQDMHRGALMPVG